MKSCATPPVNPPIASSFCTCRRRSSASTRRDRLCDSLLQRLRQLQEFLFGHLALVDVDNDARQTAKTAHSVVFASAAGEHPAIFSTRHADTVLTAILTVGAECVIQPIADLLAVIGVNIAQDMLDCLTGRLIAIQIERIAEPFIATGL